MRVEAISGYRVRASLFQQIANAQQSQVVQTQKTAASARTGRSCNRYRRKQAKRRVWVPTTSPRAPSYDPIEFSSIDHSPFELNINAFDAQDTDPLIIEKNLYRGRSRQLRRWEKFTKKRKGSVKGCLRYPKRN